jgi:Tfp pilus assembly protein PilP
VTLNNSLIVTASAVPWRIKQRPLFPWVMARLPQMLLSLFLPLLFIMPASAIGKHITHTTDATDATHTTDAPQATDATQTMDEMDAPQTTEAMDSTDANKTEKTGKVVESPIHYAGVPYKSANRRDPFLAPAKPKSSVKTDEEISRGLPPPGIAGTNVEQTILEGISIRDDRKTAIVRGRDNRTYFLREGDRLFDGYLKTIQEDSITLTRETLMRSGKKLTQEVTKRLRTP